MSDVTRKASRGLKRTRPKIHRVEIFRSTRGEGCERFTFTLHDESDRFLFSGTQKTLATALAAAGECARQVEQGVIIL